MTVWAFGDSFVDSFEKYPEYNTNGPNGQVPWVAHVGKELNHEVVNCACAGSSPEYTYYLFNKARKKIQPNDIIIVGITTLERKWFFKNRPTECVIFDPRALNKLPATKAIKQYLMYLCDNTEILETYLLNFLYSLNDLTKKLNLHTIVLPCMVMEMIFMHSWKHEFPNIHFPVGCLHNITEGQYDQMFFRKIFSTFRNDGMVNHLLWTNHEILAERIIDNILENKQIDLRNDFLTNVINEKSITSREFTEKEFSAPRKYY